MRTEATTTLRSGRSLDAPLCKTAVVTVDGLEWVLVDTEFTSDNVSLEDLKSIVNPFNWDEDYGEFFADMQSRPRTSFPIGWRRVLEKVRLVEGFDLKTPLKYFPYQDKARPYEASLEYDLDMSALATGDGRVLVDRGYIRMTALDRRNTHSDGVSVKTRKIVHIQGIPPWAQARLVCLCGYGTSSADFLLEAAADPPRIGILSCSRRTNPRPTMIPPMLPRRHPSITFPRRSTRGPRSSTTSPTAIST